MIKIDSRKLTVGTSQPQRLQLSKTNGFHTSFLDDELEAEEISIHTFFIDPFPVTNADYAIFLQETNHTKPIQWDKYATQERAHHPVVGVSGKDAESYANWAGKRLPTPPEWEAAFSESTLPTQKTLNHETHWFPQTGNYENGNHSTNPQGFGLVCEWSSATHEHFTNAKFRLLKGPSWIFEESWSWRTQTAIWVTNSWNASFIGFRCAADSDIKKAQSKFSVSFPENSLSGAEKKQEPFPNKAKLYFKGKRGVEAFFSHAHSKVSLNCPEFITADEKAQIEWYSKPEVESSSETNALVDNVDYQLKLENLDFNVSFEAQNDYVELQYDILNRFDTEKNIRASTCVRLSPYFALYDIEGARTYIWQQGRDWRLIRSYSRTNKMAPRWFANPTEQELSPNPVPTLAAVVSRDNNKVIGYGRREMGDVPFIHNNFCFTCLHLDPAIKIKAHESRQLTGRIYHLDGGLDALLKRFKSDFHL